MYHLLPPQEAAIEGVETAWAAGHRRVIVQKPTGTGKTVAYLFLAKKLRGKRTLVLAHRKELLDQPIEKLPLIWPDCDYGVVRGEKNGIWANDVVFASVQTASRPERLALLALGKFDTIIIDEAHHTPAPTYMSILSAFPDALVVGLTATPGRADKKTLSDAGYTAFAYRMSIDDAIRYDYLCPFIVDRVAVKIDLRGVKIVDGDLDQKEVAKRAKKAGLGKEVARIYCERASDRRAVIFCPSVDVAKLATEELRKRGICAAWLSDRVSDEDREKILREFKTGKTIRVVCNYGILTEGWDDPGCDCAIILRFTQSKGLYIQMVGRVLRKLLHKKNALIIDCAPNFETHGLRDATDLTTPLTKEEKIEETEGLPIFGEFVGEEGEDDAEVEVEEAKEDPEKKDRGDSMDTLLAVTAGGALGLGSDRKLVASRRVTWIDCAQDLFAIPLRGDDHVVMRRDGEEWIAHTSREELARHADMSVVQGIAEERARREGATRLSKDDAIWRSRPANAAQLRSLSRMAVFWVDGLTQGDAADLITTETVRKKYGGVHV